MSKSAVVNNALKDTVLDDYYDKAVTDEKLTEFVGDFTSKTVTVGSGGDYATINDALAYLSKYTPIYKTAGVTATINLLAGFVMAEQVLVRGLDLGWITITGADAETTITHTALTIDFTTADYRFASYPAFGVSKGGVLPRIGQLFRFSATGSGGKKHGVMAIGAGSSAEVLTSCGVADAGTYGIIAVYASTISAESVVVSGAGVDGIIASYGSIIDADGANASGAGSNGIIASRGSIIDAVNATGTLSQTKNTVTAGGIIFQ